MLSARTRIQWRYSTNPADFGQGGRSSNWRSFKPDEVGTIRTVMAKREAHLRRAGVIGGGVWYVEEFRSGGKVLTRDEIQSAIDHEDCLRNYKEGRGW